MQYIRGIEAYNGTGKSAVTLGKFDGLHRGHEKLVEQVIRLGTEHDVNSVVCSFDMLPLFERLHRPGRVLMTKAERKRRLENRVDYLVDCPFTEQIEQMGAEDFIRSVLSEIFHAAFVVVGSDFRFGHGKRGDIHMLAEYANEYGYELIVIEKEKYGDRVISSTFVKEALAEGNMALVTELLGYPYTIMGKVEHGKQLGRTLGFPTLNVPPESCKLLPPNGVYMNRILVDGTWYPAIGNVGIKPTVTESGKMLIESFLFGFDGDAYGKNVVIELYDFRRPEKKFADIEEMKRCIDQDIAYGKTYFGQ